MGYAVRPPLKSPFSACMWVIERCNLACRYCYAMPFTGAVMTTGRMLSLIDELIDLEVFDITLAGGEPFMHEGIYDAIDRLLQAGCNLGVLSNGTLLDSERIARLKEVVAGRKNFLLQISLDGIDAKTHDLTRGQGQKVLANIDHLCQESDFKLQLATVLNARNLDQVPRLIEKYYPRVKRFHFMNLQRTQRSLEFDGLFASEDRIRRFWDELDQTMERLPQDILVTGLAIMRMIHKIEDDPSQSRPGSSFDCASCTSGVTHVEIRANFDVVGCDIAKDWTKMGNVGTQSFSEVWNSPDAARVRAFPYPACYHVKDPEGRCLADQLPREMLAI